MSQWVLVSQCVIVQTRQWALKPIKLWVLEPIELWVLEPFQFWVLEPSQEPSHLWVLEPSHLRVGTLPVLSAGTLPVLSAGTCPALSAGTHSVVSSENNQTKECHLPVGGGTYGTISAVSGEIGRTVPSVKGAFNEPMRPSPAQNATRKALKSEMFNISSAEQSASCLLCLHMHQNI